MSDHGATVRAGLCPNWPHPGIMGCDYCIHAEDALAALDALEADLAAARDALAEAADKHDLIVRIVRNSRTAPNVFESIHDHATWARDAARAALAEADACHCGDLDWTVRKYGRVTHKHACPARTDPFCQTHPEGCPAEADA